NRLDELVTRLLWRKFALGQFLFPHFSRANLDMDPPCLLEVAAVPTAKTIPTHRRTRQKLKPLLTLTRSTPRKLEVFFLNGKKTGQKLAPPDVIPNPRPVSSARVPSAA